MDPRSPHRDPALALPQSHIVLICHEGYQSSLAAATLQRLGLRRATDVVGGFLAWRSAGLPVRAPLSSRAAERWRRRVSALRTEHDGFPAAGHADEERQASERAHGA